MTQGLAQSYDEITSLPLGLRAELAESVPLLDLSVEEVQRSQDGTIKVRFSARDGFPVEAVAMRHRNRRTVCVSSQSGCPLACTFCATGDMGLGRNLTSGEILEQVLVLARMLRDEDGATVGNVVMMGMGEPFLNYDQVLAAVPPASTTRTASDWARARSPSRRRAGCRASSGSPTSRCR